MAQIAMHTRVDILNNYINNGLKGMGSIYQIKTLMKERKSSKGNKNITSNGIALELIGMKDYFIHDICYNSGIDVYEDALKEYKKYDSYVLYIDILQSHLGMRELTTNEVVEYRKNNKSKIFTQGKIVDSPKKISIDEATGGRIMERVVPAMRIYGESLAPDDLEVELGHKTNAVGLLRKVHIFAKSFEKDNIELDQQLPYSRHVPQNSMSIVRYFNNRYGSIYNILQEEDEFERSRNFIRLIWLDIEARKLGFTNIKDFLEGVYKLGEPIKKKNHIMVGNIDKSVTIYFKHGGYIKTDYPTKRVMDKIGDKVSIKDKISYDMVSGEKVWSIVYKNVYNPINGDYNDLRETNLTK